MERIYLNLANVDSARKYQIVKLLKEHLPEHELDWFWWGSVDTRFRSVEGVYIDKIYEADLIILKIIYGF